MNQYHSGYRKLLWEHLIDEKRAKEIVQLMWAGTLYAGSDGSVKDGCGAHTNEIASSKKEDMIWGGAGMTPGLIDKMSSLRAEHRGGAIWVLLVRYALEI